MNLRKIQGRLNARRTSWDNVKDKERKHFTKRPGSNKKNWPRGKNKSHK